MLRRFFIIALAICAAGILPCLAQNIWQQQADRLSTLLKWRAASVVAEIGAGNGELALAAAERLGVAGKIYSNELDATKVEHLKELAATHKNIVVIKGAEGDTNLSPACCESIFMRLVYHHFTRPAEIDASLFRSLKPGGRLAVIDEEPRKGSSIPEGVPKNRGGHGIPQKILVSELAAAGFQVETVENNWPSGDEYHPLYCVVFRKP